MLSQGTLSPIADIEAKIQSRVAIFLSMKQLIINTRKVVIQIPDKAKAESLYNKQVLLETQLQKALADIDKVKAGAYTYSDILGVGRFYWDMENHIKAVKGFAEEKNIIEPTKSGTWDWAAKYIPIMAGAIGIYYAVSGRRK